MLTLLKSFHQTVIGLEDPDCASQRSGKAVKIIALTSLASMCPSSLSLQFLKDFEHYQKGQRQPLLGMHQASLGGIIYEAEK